MSGQTTVRKRQLLLAITVLFGSPFLPPAVITNIIWPLLNAYRVWKHQRDLKNEQNQNNSFIQKSGKTSAKSNSLFGRLLLTYKAKNRKLHETHHESSMGYFSLPAELRNEIMHYVHDPVLIHTEGVSTRRHRSRRAADLQITYQSLFSTIYHGFRDMQDRDFALDLFFAQWLNHCNIISNGWRDCFLPFDKVTPGYLSVSSQFRRENCHEFWTQCEFVLPPGPLEHTEQYFSRILPKNKRLIRYVAIDISWTDLTPEVLSTIEQDAAVSKKSNYNGVAWGACVKVYLARIWREKLAWIRDHSNAKRVRIMSRKLVVPNSEASVTHDLGALCRKIMVFRDTTLSEVMSGIDGTTPQIDCYGWADEVIADCMRDAESLVFELIAHHVSTVNWKFAKAWIRQFSLYKGEFDFSGERYEVNGSTAR